MSKPQSLGRRGGCRLLCEAPRPPGHVLAPAGFPSSLTARRRASHLTASLDSQSRPCAASFPVAGHPVNFWKDPLSLLAERQPRSKTHRYCHQ